MNAICRRLVFSALLTAPLAALAASGTAYVDMEKLFQGYYKTARADASFKKQKELYSEHAKDTAAEIEAIKMQRDEMQERTLNIALSDEARAQSRKSAEEKDALYREKKKDLQEFMVKTDKELQKKYLDLRGDLVKELSEFIGNHGRERGLDLILDVSGLTRNFIPVVVYYNQENDITEAVLAELNRGHEDEVPKAGNVEPPATTVPAEE